MGDFNGDGSDDVALATVTNSVGVMINAANDVANRAGAVGFTVSAPSAITSGANLSLTVTAVDATGAPVTGFRGTVFFTSSDPQMRAIPLFYTFTAADNGTHVFPQAMTLATPGNQTVTVSTPGMADSINPILVTPAPTHLAVAAPAAVTAGAPFSITVTPEDASGRIATGYTGTVRFLSSDLQASLPSSYTFTPADAGSHTFTATLKSAGTASMTVMELSGAFVTASAVTVSPAAASSLSVTGGAGAVGVAHLVTVTARDPFGNLATTDNGTVHFTTTDPLAVLPPDGALLGGVGNFTLKLMTVGTQSITATDTANPALSGTETGIAATPAIAASLLVTGFPATSVAGVSQPVTVTVISSVGKVATNYTGTLLFSSSDVKAGLPVSYTFTAADAGVHTFSVALMTAGTQSITARDQLDSTVVGIQKGIVVTPAAVASFFVTGFPTTTAGAAQNFTVKATDAYGNVVADYTGTVAFSSSDAQASLPASYTFSAADAGVHTFTATLKTAALQSIGVSDTASSTLFGNQAGIDVVAAAATHFSVSVPNNLVAGTAFSVKVTAIDAFGNEASGYRGKVHFSTKAASASLPSDYTFTAADNGVHNFSVVMNSTGAQTLTITDAASPVIMGSVGFNVGTTAVGGGGGSSGSGGGSGSGGTGGGSGGGSGGGKTTPA